MPRVFPGRALAAFLLLIGLVSPLWADGGTSPLPFRYERLDSDYEINPDGSATQTYTAIKRLLTREGVAQARQDALTFSSSIQDGEVLEAYTLKPDGQRLDVPRDNYQVTTNTGHHDGDPFFSDRNQITVVYPGLEVGDRVGLRYRIRDKVPMFPGKFSLYTGFSKFAAYDAASISIDAPAAFRPQVQAYNLEAEPVREHDGRRTWRWTYRSEQPSAWDAGDRGIEQPEELPVVFFSTFRSYREIAEEYGRRARPKAAVTARLRQLAEIVTAGQSGEKEKARALYDWVAANIAYGGNCIGVGAVVPRDLDIVLDNRLGDCKDHATLLQALLAAVGVKSSQALINAGNQYELPRVPVVANVNHVINYLPGLDLYVDSTTPGTPFGQLPLGLAGKPVLRVDDYRDGTHTAPDLGEGNVQDLTLRLTVNADGSAHGELAVALRGRFAEQARGWFKDMPAGRRGELVKAALQQGGLQGSGSLEPDPLQDLDDRYGYSADFTVENYLANPDAGAFGLFPLLPTPGAVGGLLSSSPTGVVQRRSVICSGGHASETYHITLPAGMKLLYLPKPREIAGQGLSYHADYAASGNTLQVTRRLDDRVESNVCTPELGAARQTLEKQMRRDLNAQVLYQQAP